MDLVDAPSVRLDQLDRLPEPLGHEHVERCAEALRHARVVAYVRHQDHSGCSAQPDLGRLGVGFRVHYLRLAVFVEVAELRFANDDAIAMAQGSGPHDALSIDVGPVAAAGVEDIVTSSTHVADLRVPARNPLMGNHQVTLGRTPDGKPLAQVDLALDDPVHNDLNSSARHLVRKAQSSNGMPGYRKANRVAKRKGTPDTYPG